jgi:hypothetical protein
MLFGVQKLTPVSVICGGFPLLRLLSVPDNEAR